MQRNLIATVDCFTLCQSERFIV